MSYRRISQREARATQKELAELREFVHGLRWCNGPKLEIGRTALCDISRGRIEGARAVNSRAILACEMTAGAVVCYVFVPPAERAP